MSKTLRNTEEEARDFLPRFRLLYTIITIASILVLLRLVYLQIISGNELREFSERNRVKETKIPAPRGLILDRGGQVLVENLPGFVATIKPQYATQLDSTAEAVGKALNMNPQDILRAVRDGRRKNGPFRPVKIKENLNLKDLFRLKLLLLDHPGLDIQETIVRYFPLGENGAQLFGYVGEISKDQLERFNKKRSRADAFEQGDLIGKSGMEEILDHKIRGQDGIWFVEVDARGREAKTENPSYFGFSPQEPVPGNNIVLTIDKDIQIAAYQAMMQRQDAKGPRIGSLVAMKSNGEILAWLSSPSFNPNEFSTGIDPAQWSKLVNDPHRPLRNKVIQDHYSPGSTLKPIVALAALQEKIIRGDTLVFSPGQLKFGNRFYHDHTKHGHGNVTVLDAIERSTNVFFYKMGISLGIDRMSKYASLLGLGRRTDIRLPNEVSGVMPTSEWKAKVFGEEWQPGENLSSAIGQGYVLATGLQMAIAYNTMGLEGKVYAPFYVKQIVGPDGKIIEENGPKMLRDISLPGPDGVFISKENFQTVNEGMRRVANGAFGTAKWWKIPGVEMAGKTGTSQVMSFSSDQIYAKCESRPLRQRHHGWYVAFAPAHNPEITVAVLSEHACHGSTGSAPIVRDVILAYMQKYHPDLLKKASSVNTPDLKTEPPTDGPEEFE